MKQVPYHGNPGNACALACYTMIAQYLLPDKHITFEQLAKLANWRKGYVVWGFAVWKYLMDEGIHMVDYDTIDYAAWAEKGAEGLRESTSPKEFEFYESNTYDLEEESRLVHLMMDHPNFTYVRRKPTWEDVVNEFRKPGICDLGLNKRALDRQEGFVLHRVVVIDISEDEVIFHDPNQDSSGAYRHEPLSFFREVFESIDGPELARYSLE